jgi:hypothetical protein
LINDINVAFVEVDARAQELGLSEEEYVLLNVVKNYLSNRSENDLAAFVKELDREIKTMLFLDWHRKVKMATEENKSCLTVASGSMETTLI